MLMAASNRGSQDGLDGLWVVTQSCSTAGSCVLCRCTAGHAGLRNVSYVPCMGCTWGGRVGSRWCKVHDGHTSQGPSFIQQLLV